jgi:SAM-dependent methyltransferase
VTNTDRRYFEDMYTTSPDPWRFETSWYEQRKYALTVDALPRPRYRSAFEPGCSIGVLSALLAPRCERLLSTEIIGSALDRARARLTPSPHVRLEQRAIPEQWPAERFDLLVLSEIAYYFDAVTLRHIVDLATSSMEGGATVVAVHWRGRTDYPLSGDRAHEILDEDGRLHGLVHHVEPEFVLDVWQTVP